MNETKASPVPYNLRHRRPSIGRYRIEQEQIANAAQTSPQAIKKTELDNERNESEESSKTDINHSSDSEAEENILPPAVRKSKESYRKITKEQIKAFSYLLLFVIFWFICVMVLYSYFCDCSEEKVTSLKDVTKEFSIINNEILFSFKSGVDDVTLLNRPSTFIYLYDGKHERIVNDFVNKLAKYASFRLGKSNPIIVTDDVLNSAKYQNDYGAFIYEYVPKLRESGVMVVKHLENVSGKSARAFHSICDQYSPAVEQSVIIFTMQVNDKLPTNSYRFVDNYYKQKWSDIDMDHYVALMARLGNMVENIEMTK